MKDDQLADRIHQSSLNEKVNILFSYLKEFGDENYEEDVTQYEHAMQTAILAKREDASAEMITAALLHDIGHMLADDPQEVNNPTIKNDLHEEIAAEYLSEFFPPAVTEPIRLHVPAKRYLCMTDNTYYEGLSEASKKSFHLQGGEMTHEELLSFESNSFYKEAVQLRKWDDMGKTVGLDLPPINIFARSLAEAFYANLENSEIGEVG